MEDNKYSLAVESPIELWINNSHITTFLCSPYDLIDLAIGHSITRGMISNIKDIKSIEIIEKENKIFLTVDNIMPEEKFTVPKIILSGVSSINSFNDNIYKIPSVNKDIKIPLDSIIKYSNMMIDDSIIYKDTGGVHAAIIKEINGKSFLREDVGRHSAVDKSIGAFLLDKADIKNSFIATTGRLSLDMILKSAVVGIPIIASLKRPSNLAFDLANHYGITIIARILSDKPIIYTNKEKIII